jgi:hypothetical protein
MRQFSNHIKSSICQKAILLREIHCSFSKRDASKKETVHKHRHCPIIDLMFHPGERPHSQKQCFQQGHCQAQPIKARRWIFTLKGKTLNFSCAVAPTFDAAAPSHESPSQFHLATKTRTTLASPRISASMIFSAS